MAINPPLLALAVGAFGIGVTEFTPMGMLPLIAGDLGVSIPAAGLVISAYALGVLVGAPLMTLASARIPRRRLLVGLMAIFTLGNAIGAAVGGGVIDAGLGYDTVPLAGAALAALGLAFLLWLRRDGRVRAAAAASCG